MFKGWPLQSEPMWNPEGLLERWTDSNGAQQNNPNTLFKARLIGTEWEKVGKIPHSSSKSEPIILMNTELYSNLLPTLYYLVRM